MKSKFLSYAFSLALVLSLFTTGCAALLMLPDELSEDHYRTQAGDIAPQVKSKQQSFPGAKLLAGKEGSAKQVGVLPVVYIYDTTNTLKKNEEAYYTSIFNNSSGSWIRPFAVDASNAIREELKARGFDTFIYANSDFKALGYKQAPEQMGKLFGTAYKAIAYNGDSEDTNYAATEVSGIRKAIVNDIPGVAYMKIQADWEPSTANRLHGDIVLNTAINIGYEIVLCGAQSNCSTVKIPFEKGVGTHLLMPNRNTINEKGLDKNYDFIRSVHGDQLRTIVKLAFERFDAEGVFKP